MYLQVKKGALWDRISAQQVIFERHSATVLLKQIKALETSQGHSSVCDSEVYGSTTVTEMIGESAPRILVQAL